MMLDSRSALSSYMAQLLSEGRLVFSRDEAQEALGTAKGAFLDAAEHNCARDVD